MDSLDQIIGAYHGVEKAVVATLVELQGSGFRRPGARMLVKTDGSHIGSISGGCLEKDVARACFALTEDGPQKVLYDTRADAVYPQGMYGTGCEGMVYLLLEQVANDLENVLDVIATARAAREAIVIVTGHEGELLGNVACFGSAGFDGPDGRFESVLKEASRLAFHDRKSHQLEVRSDSETHKFLIEYISPRPKVLIVGTGDDAQSLAAHTTALGWDAVICSDDPMKLADLGVPTQTLPFSDHSIDPETAVVFISHNFDLDETYLRSVMESEAFYVGLLGPRRRTARLFTELMQVAPFDLERVHAPAGLDLGSDEPSAVALSIAAEIVAVKNRRMAGMLSVEKPAHIQTRLETRIVHISEERNSV